MLREIPAEPSVTEKLGEIVTASPNGAVIFWNNEVKYLVVPPFPVADRTLTPSLDIAPLRSLVSHEYLMGLVLVRLGSYAIGVCRGDTLISSKAGTGLVHGRHRQGGSSAHRFERHRDKQIESFLIRVCGHVHEQLEPYVKSIDYIVYGGARTTILLLQKYCPLLGKLDKPVLPPLLDIPEPRRAVLESAISRVWSSTLYEWQED
jgi:peptide subunit release factor 1 (eRF1)